MTKEQRQLREREEMKTLILQAAGRLISEEGLDKLSIRKIAETIEYSPGVIYHYFQGKEAIVEQVLQTGHQKMLAGLQSVQSELQPELPPEQLLKQSLLQFIRMSLSQGEQYRNVMLGDSPAVLSYTSVLFKGASEEREAIRMLCQSLRGFKQSGSQGEAQLELTAQVIWSAAFGLITRLTVEKNLPEEQVKALISRYLDSMVAIASM